MVPRAIKIFKLRSLAHLFTLMYTYNKYVTFTYRLFIYICIYIVHPFAFRKAEFNNFYNLLISNVTDIIISRTDIVFDTIHVVFEETGLVIFWSVNIYLFKCNVQ